MLSHFNRKLNVYEGTTAMGSRTSSDLEIID